LKADTMSLYTIFGKDVQYVVPLFQRPYVWKREEQWEPLWNDIAAVAEREVIGDPAGENKPHFLGAVVLEQTPVPVAMIDARSVIDGQQRLTTIQIILAAARSVAISEHLDTCQRKLEKLLFNELFLVRREGDQYKVIPTARDQRPFREAVEGAPAAATGKHRMHEAYRFFRGSILEWATDGGDHAIEGRLDALANTLWKRLVVVAIDLDSGDDAQVIFETLNARGTPLLAADLVKNYLFQRAVHEGSEIQSLYDRHWEVLDGDWWREEVQQGRLKRPRLDIFLNHWLSMTTGKDVVSQQLFAEFKRYVEHSEHRAENVLEDLARYASVYKSFDIEPPQSPLGRFLYRLTAMEVTTAFPLLLWLLGPDGITDDAERQPATDGVESWLVRRMLVRATTKNYNNVFLGLLKAVRGGGGSDRPTGEDVVGFLAGLEGESQAWPTAGEVISYIRGLPIYTALSRSRLRMILEALEYISRTGLTEDAPLPRNLTIEHVLPQEWASNWPLPENEDPIIARTRRDTLKHTLGNLTLVTGKLNPTMSNGAWPIKRDALRDYSLLRIAADIRSAETWDEATIVERTERLGRLTVDLWKRPDDRWEVPVVPAPTAERATDPIDSEDGFSGPFAIADSAGVGDELRSIVSVSRRLGLHPRADKYSVMITPASDHRVMLYTVWPQADDGGSFRIWKSPSAFARHVPGVTLNAAQAALGVSEGAGVMNRGEVGSFLNGLKTIVGGEVGSPLEGSTPPTSDGSVTGSVESHEDDVTLPEDVWRVIERHASLWIQPLAREFAKRALGHEGVILRAQQTKGDPSYFQVRHPRFSQVVAYVHPRQSDLFVQYRLPAEHETYGLAESRDNFYGITMNVMQPSDVAAANQLLVDALDIGLRAGGATETEVEAQYLPKANAESWEFTASILELTKNARIADLTRTFVAWADERGLGYSRTREPEIRIETQRGGIRYPLLSIHVSERVYLQFGWWRGKPVLGEESIRAEVAREVSEAIGVVILIDHAFPAGQPRAKSGKVRDGQVRVEPSPIGLDDRDCETRRPAAIERLEDRTHRGPSEGGDSVSEFDPLRRRRCVGFVDEFDDLRRRLELLRGRHRVVLIEPLASVLLLCFREERRELRLQHQCLDGQIEAAGVP
jgi:hypothetical protein